MANRLATAISPYLRSHSDNPVDWFPWGEEAFAEAVRRDVPVLVSIGYSTCHWCHVMARESFSDPALAAVLNDGFVAIKVDREEHPEVDSVYLAAAGAFTQNLGWPLNVFATPGGRVFFAGTYSPPVAVQGNPSFRQVLDAVQEAWRSRRSDVESTAAQLVEALAEAGSQHAPTAGQQYDSPVSPDPELPTTAELAQVVFELDAYEDTVHGGFGTAPKFPVAPVLRFLQAMDAPLADRTLKVMAASPLRDPIEGGFFRYATQQDWSDPHYERMLYDNALLLDAYTTAAEKQPGADWAKETALGIADYLMTRLQQPEGGFGSAQDSESTVGGVRTEGGYYGLDAGQRAAEVPPAVDLKILTGWNGLAIGALAHAGSAFGENGLLDSARQAADYLLAHHLRADGTVVRASLGGRVSEARATLEDYGMLSAGLLRLGTATGDKRYSAAGAALLDAVLEAGAEPGESDAPAGSVGTAQKLFVVPGGGDPVLAARGLLLEGDVSEGAYPSGNSAAAEAAYLRYRETGDAAYRSVALRALAPLGPDALSRPIGFGAALELMVRLRAEARSEGGPGF
ncbi:hypothetical protein B7R54_12030 [Subtercola boreus]|uniref:Spermatogenesis-associated protein 20-like TRX domain-containing protein n=1 Tax=Subtercola boreus TaxID=120213 RepID=A0A3E0VKA8_9MICO|nr:DUF255 domain-containing protein [Subtercola boreus]RFA09850.1 hypothetical protein B7R54_12030 [Subtercola boreus]TQL53025.1 hypothetical protein FB464_0516 [Subtercola boreus]